MEIGEPQRIHEIEPLDVPVPSSIPIDEPAPSDPARPAPREPAAVPAPPSGRSQG